MVEFLGVAWENILVGLMGGFIVSGIFLIGRKANEWLIQRRFPVAGAYITKFEDEEGGNKYMATAPATLEQHGRKITGTTIMGSREWILQGELSPSGYIHGVYFAKDPVDKGLGNFFLRIYNDRRMIGLWSGYDSVNDSITSGRYTFLPVRDTVTTRPGTAGDLLSVLRIADDQLGEGYVSEEFFIKADESDRSFIKVAEMDGRIVGFAIGLIWEPNEIRELVRVPIPRHLSLADQVGVVKTVAVSPAQHGHGIGTRLTDSCLAEFRSRGVRAVCSVAWKRGKQINLKGVLERQGFLPFAEVPDYWREESLEEDFECPECGAPPCRCSAVMYSQVL